mmetsp:Transcript_21956/g.30159  ORF Transcript_21956/g.30159 Transcript_21956/m.30159 type:complete len:268 (+) Transcript_21956:26-829(+)
MTEFRLFLPILPDQYTATDTSFEYPLTIGNIKTNKMPDLTMQVGCNWELRVDTYVSTDISFVGLKTRGSNDNALELKVRKPEISSMQWLEYWTKYKLKAKKSSLQKTLKECLSAEGYQHLLDEIVPKISDSANRTVSVRKSRKKNIYDKVTLEMTLISTDIAPTKSDDPQWISYAVEAENPSDILEYFSALGSTPANESPSPWDCALNLLKLIRCDDRRTLPMPILSGYPMWLQYITASVENPTLLDDAMSRLTSFESFINDCRAKK